MFERHDASEDRTAGLIPGQRNARSNRPVADREVPLTGGASMSIGDMPPQVHQWLDGELSERIARHADSRNVELWNRISAETGRRNHMKTPSHLSERVMAVLPNKKPSRLDVLRRPFRIRPITFAAIGAGLVVAGVYAERLLFR